MIPNMGLKCGSMINAALEATAMAHITAIVTSSLAWGFFFVTEQKRDYRINDQDQAAQIIFSISEMPGHHQSHRHQDQDQYIAQDPFKVQYFTDSVCIIRSHPHL